MKMKFTLFFACLLLLAAPGFAKSRTIEGNGKLVTKKIEISDYDAISTIGAMEFEYEKSSSGPFLEITVDENILPYLDIRVKGHTLTFGFKDLPRETEVRDGDVHTYTSSISPTKFKVKSRSKDLNELNLVGGCNMTVKSVLDGYKINADLVGGGSIDFEKAVKMHKGKFTIAGGGNVTFDRLDMTNIECSVAGGGSINLKGEAERGDFNVAGGGTIEGFDYKLKKADCNVAGGGTIRVYASEFLDANVAAGGKIRYKGDPEVSKNTVAGGSIKKEY
ncbi:head GIN domain-containing protein [Parabacteroides sp. APC149_11_2_Y6]